MIVTDHFIIFHNSIIYIIFYWLSVINIMSYQIYVVINYKKSTATYSSIYILIFKINSSS